jgi:hypothetical protein
MIEPLMLLFVRVPRFPSLFSSARLSEGRGCWDLRGYKELISLSVEHTLLLKAMHRLRDLCFGNVCSLKSRTWTCR